MVEQDCPYPELDGKDLDAIHVWAIQDQAAENPGQSAEAVVRVLPPGVSYGEPSIGRVAVSLPQRGSGLGAELMERSIRLCMRKWPSLPVRISAQQYLIHFYQSLGFEPEGEGYLEDGIPHVAMVKPPFLWEKARERIHAANEKFEAVARGVDGSRWKGSLTEWGVSEIIGHLMVSEGSLFQYMAKKSLADPLQLPLADLESDGRGLNLIRQLESPKRWKDPTGKLVLRDEPHVTGKGLEAMLSQWRDQQNIGLEGMMRSMDGDSWWSALVFRHPLAGYISLADTLIFMATHIEHHIHQLHRMTNSPS